MGVSSLHLLEFNGRYFTPKHDICVLTLTDEVLQETLSHYTRYGAFVHILQVSQGILFQAKSGQDHKITHGTSIVRLMHIVV